MHVWEILSLFHDLWNFQNLLWCLLDPGCMGVYRKWLMCLSSQRHTREDMWNHNPVCRRAGKLQSMSKEFYHFWNLFQKYSPVSTDFALQGASESNRTRKMRVWKWLQACWVGVGFLLYIFAVCEIYCIINVSIKRGGYAMLPRNCFLPFENCVHSEYEMRLNGYLMKPPSF